MSRILFLIFLSSCVTIPFQTPEPKQEALITPPPKIEAPTYPRKGWIPAYDEAIKSAVTDRMVKVPAAQMAKFCNSWGTMPTSARIQFFADLLYSIAAPESGYDNQSIYLESELGIDAVTKLPVISEGLLQLSYQDAQGYPKCDFNAEKDLTNLKDDLVGRDRGNFASKHPERDTLNPFKNLACGMAIIDKLLEKHPTQEFGDMMGRYWSTMRRANKRAYLEIWDKLRERKTPCR